MPLPIIERSANDTTPIYFSWPFSNATISASVSIGSGAFVACVGVVSFLRSESGVFIYSLSYNSADRPASGAARYMLTDGSVTRYLTLSIESVGSVSSAGSSYALPFMGGQFGGNVLTLSDLVNKLQHRAGQLESEDRMERLMLYAIRDALRDLPSMYNWAYYKREFRINPSPTVSIQSMTYVASTGNATISSGEAVTWPADAIYGEVAIGNVRYKVVDVVSNKVAIITGPRTDFTGMAEWSRAEYKIPGIRRIHTVSEEGTNRLIEYLTPQLIHQRELIYHSPGTPVHYTVSSGERECSIRFSPPPSAGTRMISISAGVSPAYPEVFRADAICNGVAGESSLTTTASKKWIGAVIRLTAHPTDPDSGRQRIIDGDYEWQAVITDVQDNIVSLSAPLPKDLDDEFCIVSSIVDVAITKQTFFECLAYMYFCRSHRHDGLADAMKISSMTQREAQAADTIASRNSPIGLEISKYWPIEDLKAQWIAS
jgi:hypothetical protein